MLRVSELIKVVEMEQALGVSNKGACFGVTDPSRLRPAWKSFKKPREELKEIFVVGWNSKVTVARISTSVWENILKCKKKILVGKQNFEAVPIGSKGFQNVYAKYGYFGFEKESEAGDFSKAVRLAEEAKRKKKKKK